MADKGTVQLYLEQLACSLAASSQYLQAVKCLEAIVSQSLLPADEAQNRLRIAKLLMDHTHNINQAKQHLLKAQLLVQKVPGQFALKCEIAAQLAQCYQHIGEPEFQLKALQDALNFLSSGVSAPDRPLVPVWSCYFHLRLAENYISATETQAAFSSVEAGLRIAEEHGLMKEKMLFLLFKLHICLLVWERHAAEAGIRAAVEQLNQMAAGPGTTPLLNVQLKLHLNVLQAVFNIKLGNFSELGRAENGVNILISSMEELAAALEGQHLEYQWLPAPLYMPLVQLLSAVVLKPKAQLAPAQVHISRGLEGLKEYLQQQLPLGDGEEQLDHINIHGARMALVLQVLLRDVSCQLHLLGCQFAEARADIAANIRLLQRYPTLLQVMVPVVHLQAGLYAQALGYHQYALAHLMQSSRSSGCKLHKTGCDALTALALVAGGGEGAVSQAAEVLGNYYQSTSATSDSELGYSERAACGLASGVVWLKQGEYLEAKQRLGKVLQLAHKQLSNHQLVSQVLLFMVPTQLSTDASADRSSALEMAKSSVTLSRSAGDVRTMVDALKMAEAMFGEGKEQDATASQNHNYLLKKQEELSQRIQAADVEEQEQQLVLNWGLAAT